MAQINKPNQYFNTKLYTGNGGTQSITGVGFQPDMTWVKSRTTGGGGNNNHCINDVVRAKGTYGYPMIHPNLTASEYDPTSGNEVITDFQSDGFDLGGNENSNYNTATYASWNWSAGGTAPSKTYTVKVVSDGGNKYRFDDFGTSAVTLEISEGGTYTFDQADSSNSGHPIRFSTTSDGSHGGGSEYTTGVTTNGTPGNAGAYTRITVAASAPTLYYYCSVHSGMGGQANTPTTNSFSNFAGSIQSNVSPNTTTGFSIVSYTGNGTDNATVGHGLSQKPDMVIIKARENTSSWLTWHKDLTGAGYAVFLDATDAQANYNILKNQSSSVLTLSTNSAVNANTQGFISYNFHSVQGYSKFGSYTGNGSTDGTFVYTGFKPAFVMFKNTTTGSTNWHIVDTKRNTFNIVDKLLFPNDSGAEGTQSALDLTSNGFKIRVTNGFINTSGNNYIYMAFAENPLVGTNNIPATAR